MMNYWEEREHSIEEFFLKFQIISYPNFDQLCHEVASLAWTIVHYDCAASIPNAAAYWKGYYTGREMEIEAC
jgi:hypothetical protein